MCQEIFVDFFFLTRLVATLGAAKVWKSSTTVLAKSFDFPLFEMSKWGTKWVYHVPEWTAKRLVQLGSLVTEWRLKVKTWEKKKKAKTNSPVFFRFTIDQDYKIVNICCKYKLKVFYWVFIDVSKKKKTKKFPSKKKKFPLFIHKNFSIRKVHYFFHDNSNILQGIDAIYDKKCEIFWSKRLLLM